MYSVVLSREAEQVYAAAEVSLARKIARCLARLEADPRSGNNVKRLTGPLAGLYRYRIGDWRVVYEVDDAASVVSVVTIAHRRDAYD